MDEVELVAKAMFEEASRGGLMHGVWDDLKATVDGCEYDGQELWLGMARVAIEEIARLGRPVPW